MNATFASWLITAIGVYLAVGVAFAVAFVARGVARIDPAAKESGFGFKILILPAATALWPLLAKRWISGTTEPAPERNAHREAASR